MTTSPCVSVCQLDPKTRVCIGCGRTIAEIAAWPNLSETERQAIVRRLAASAAAASEPSKSPDT